MKKTPFNNRIRKSRGYLQGLPSVLPLIFTPGIQVVFSP